MSLLSKQPVHYESPDAGHELDIAEGIPTLLGAQVVPAYKPNPVVRLLDRAKFEVASVLGAYPVNFVTRAQWGAQPAKRTSTSITPQHGGVAWHYEGPKVGSRSHSECAHRVRQIQAFHMGPQRGWADIAYSLLVCEHGFIFEGRGIGKRTAANGTNTGNQTHYAICGMLGEGDVLTEAMLQAFLRGTRWLRERGSAAKSVKPHNYFKPTGCPGEPVRAQTARYDGHDISEPTPAPEPAPAPAPTPTPAPAPAPTNAGTGATTAYRDQTYRSHPSHATPLTYRGDTTPSPEWVVKDIQGHLNYAYYDHKVNVPLLKIDGDFGPTTEARVKDWQRRTGLGVDGKVGSGTWSRLHSVSKGRRVDNTGKAF